MRRLFFTLFMVALLAPSAWAQEFIRLNPTLVSDTISSNGDSVTLTNAGVGGFGSVKVQALDSYSGTWEVQCTLAGTVVSSTSITSASYDAAMELKLTPWDGSTAVVEITDTVGGWDVQNAAGCRAIRVVSTSGFAASDTIIVISATQSGGGSGGGGSSTDITDYVNDLEGYLDTVETVLGTINTAVQLIDNATYVDDADWTALTSYHTLTGCIYQSTPGSITDGDTGPLRCTANGKIFTYATLADANGTALTLATDYTTNAAAPTDPSGPTLLGERDDVLATLSSEADAEWSNVRLNSRGALWVAQDDPCTSAAKLYLPVDITTGTTTEITPSLAGSSTHYYICSIHLVTDAANDVSLVDDNTDGCGSVTAGLAGGLTAGEGWNFVAGGGIALGNGASAVMRTQTANSVLCLVTSAATQLAGHLVVVAAP